MTESLPSNLFVGTSSWSSRDWCGSFYPDAIEPGQMIAYYAGEYRTVEIDSTWHYMPNQAMVNAWRERTPAGFVFSAKVPKVISHEKYLEDCEEDLNRCLFQQPLRRLRPRIGRAFQQDVPGRGLLAGVQSERTAA